MGKIVHIAYFASFAAMLIAAYTAAELPVASPNFGLALGLFTLFSVTTCIFALKVR